MNSPFHLDPVHLPEASIGASHPTGSSCTVPQVAKTRTQGIWHPLLRSGLTTLGTFTLLGLEVLLAQAANAQVLTAEAANAQAATPQVAVTQPVAIAQPSDQPAEAFAYKASTTTAGDLDSLTIAATNPVNYPANHPSAISFINGDSFSNQNDDSLINENDDRRNDSHSGNEAIEDRAIESSRTLTVDAVNPNPSSPDASDFDRLRMGTETENAELLESTGTEIAQGGSALLGAPFIQLQGAVVVQGDEFSARARATASYAITPNLLVGGTLDLVTGDAFTDSPEAGLNLNELYIAVSPSEIPTLRFAAGLLDYTSYFDRNSFAKDGVTQFFNPVFQTNPALAAAGLSSRPGLLVNWSVTDNLELRAAGFSSRRNLGDFALDGFAAEAAVRVQNLIVRGTFLTAKDAGDDSGFREIFQFDRGSGDFGLRSGDREQAFGINAEYFVPSMRLGLFARYGWYDNLTLGRGGETYSFGFNLLDLFMQDDRLGLAYGRDLSNDRLRQRRGDDLPDVLELFYDARLLPNLRAGFTAQARNSFSETILGFRVRADVSLSDLGGIFR